MLINFLLINSFITVFCYGRYSQKVQGPVWDKQDLWLDVPLQCIQQGKMDVQCHCAVMGPNRQRTQVFKKEHLGNC